MCPRPGGEANKLGNHYEGAWTVRQLLDVLVGTADSVTVEDLGEIGQGVEFTLRRPEIVETHQVKRQHGSAHYWTLGELRSAGVLEAARHHVAAGREFHFISMIPARDLDRLAGRARRSRDLKSFLDDMEPQQDGWGKFDYLSTILGSAQQAWQTLRGTWAQCVDERELRHTNAALAGLLLRGAPPLAAAVTLADLVLENLATPIDRSTIVDSLPNGLSLSGLIGSPSVARAVGNVLASWKSGIARELVRPSIPRDDAQRIVDRLQAGERCLFTIGEGGIGKSVVLYDVVESLESRGWSVLALRLDREEPFSTTSELGARLGLDTSPVSALAAVAQDTHSLLVIDQLDAISKASGRMPLTVDAVADLVREAGAFPKMRLVLACRKFDFENDDRIRTLAKEQGAGISEISHLSDDQVHAALEAMGVDAELLSTEQIGLLRSPFNLKLLSSLSDQSDVLTFNSTTELLHAYWERKRRDCRQRLGTPVRFSQVIGALADEMSRRQRLTVPASLLDEEDLAQDADVLISEHVLVKDGRQLAFFHESFFDYAFARRWSLLSQTLTEFLLEGEQELFRRAQIRQILTHLRDEDPDRFRSEMKSVLVDDRVRYHVKDVVLSMLRALPDPTAGEWRIVTEVLDTSPRFTERLWRALRTSPWFVRLDTEGVIEGWLTSNERTKQHRALEIMAGGAEAYPDRIAELLAPHANRQPDFARWVAWLLRFAEPSESRGLFDLVLVSVREGRFDGLERELFLGLRNLGEHRPGWAVELLVAYLADRPDAFQLDDLGRVMTLLSRDHGVIRMATTAAEQAPVVFAERVVPYLTRAASCATGEGDHDPISSWHLKDLELEEEVHHELGDAVLAGAVSAIRKMAQEEPSRVRPLLEHLAGFEHETSQRLLYEGLAASGEEHAAWALELLLEQKGRLSTSDGWTLRRVITEISPHLNDGQFKELEDAVISCRPSWETRPRGRRSFLLLTAMEEERLTRQGRRRLGELRRLFQTHEPTEPEGLRMVSVESPIPATAASKMSDDQWLRAMDRYSADETDWVELRGGALELSRVLHKEVKTDPARFARLALRLTDEHHPAYLGAVLRGLGESQVPVDPPRVFEAVRHISGIADEGADRWLGWALRPHLKEDLPDDLIRMLLDRALEGSNPATTDDQTEDDHSASASRDPLEAGINTTRGATVRILGDAVVFDADGRRTAMVVPVLNKLASDPSVAVRACTAHLVAACLRDAELEAIGAFHELVRCHDRLLATRHVKRLILLLGNRDVSIVVGVIRRMLSSDDTKVRKAGGALAAYAGLELAQSELLAAAVGNDDEAVRSGAAEACAARLPHTADAEAARTTIHQLAQDPEESVRNSAASVASSLRGQHLQPFEDVLVSLIESPTFEAATPQLLITLDRAPDRVGNLILKAAKRFVELHGDAAGDISTGAAGDARQVGELLLRAYAQAPDAESRSEALDHIDELLVVGAYGIDELVRTSER